jgi:hypothetical protein
MGMDLQMDWIEMRLECDCGRCWMTGDCLDELICVGIRWDGGRLRLGYYVEI